MLGIGTSINTSTGKTGSAAGQPAAVMSYYSDFTSDADGFDSDGSTGSTDPTINFNVDNIGGRDDCLSMTLTSEPTGTFYLERNGTADAQGWKIGDSVSVEFEIRFADVAPVNSTDFTFQVRLGGFHSSRRQGINGTADDTWRTVTHTFDNITQDSGTSSANRSFALAFNASGSRPANGDIIYIRNVSVIQSR